jgi:outer membrane lipoprotein carrier protein
MKKISYLIIVMLISVTASFAQKDARALDILEAVSKRYKAMSAYKAQFTYAMESPSTSMKESYTGDIAVKGTKYYLKLGSQEIINNGSTVWTYLRDVNEVNISDYEPSDDEITPTKIYDLYKKGYKASFLEEVKEGGQVYEVVDLVPENKNSQVFKIRLMVNKKDKALRSWKIFEKNGNRYVYTLEQFTPGDLDDKMFAFDKSKYKDVEVVDLR